MPGFVSHTLHSFINVILSTLLWSNYYPHHSFYRWANWVTKTWRNLSWVTQPVSGRAENETLAGSLAFNATNPLNRPSSVWKDFQKHPSHVHLSGVSPTTCSIITVAAAAKSLQSCPTLCNPIDGSPPGSRIPGILQARTLEWVAISFSNAWKWKLKVKSFSHVWLLATPSTAAYQAPLLMGYSRQEHWSGLPLPSPLHCL